MADGEQGQRQWIVAPPGPGQVLFPLVESLPLRRVDGTSGSVVRATFNQGPIG